ncbi:MAG: hypothetical protein AB7P14_01670 [Blastocatellales bacterium]
MRNFIFAFLFLFLPIALPFGAFAQSQIEIRQSGETEIGRSSATRFYYLFENERFTTPLQEVKFDGAGHGTFRFKRKDSDEIVNELDVSPVLLSQIQLLFSDLNFLESNVDYQHKKDFSHLGTVTIAMSRDGKERMVKFNYTDNTAMSKLRELFQNLAIQETRVFEMETVRSNDPISTPAQLRMLESELRSKHIADPNRFVPILKDIKLDEGVPLIARNHAERLLQSIKKGK